jgi:hypothetical protein
VPKGTKGNNNGSSHRRQEREQWLREQAERDDRKELEDHQQLQLLQQKQQAQQEAQQRGMTQLGELLAASNSRQDRADQRHEDTMMVMQQMMTAITNLITQGRQPPWEYPRKRPPFDCKESKTQHAQANAST